MTNAVTTRNGNGGEPVALENIIIRGDLSSLTADQRSQYYLAVCKSVGLNPLTQPMQYITLNGRLTLYALRNCTDQLRAIHNVSVAEMSETEREGVHIVTCKVVNAAGRTDIAKGAVNIAGLKGEALANAIMKAETKAKRRATLSICGLSLLDETEIEDIPAEAKRPTKGVGPAEEYRDIPGEDTEFWWPPAGPNAEYPKVTDQRIIWGKLVKEMKAIEDINDLRGWKDAREEIAQQIRPEWLKLFSAEYWEHFKKLAGEVSQ